MEQNNQQTQQEYHNITSKIFKNSLINIPLFAVPAFLALFLGQKLDTHFESGNMFLIILLFSAFTISWIVVLKRSSKINKEYRALRQKMKEEKEVENKNKTV